MLLYCQVISARIKFKMVLGRDVAVSPKLCTDPAMAAVSHSVTVSGCWGRYLSERGGAMEPRMGPGAQFVHNKRTRKYASAKMFGRGREEGGK